METNSNQSSSDGAKTAEKMLNDSPKEIMDFYTKQLNVATGFYKNIFDSFLNGNKGWNNSSDFSNGFLNNDHKAFAMPFNGMNSNFANPFVPTFDKVYKQMVDYNTTMSTNLTNGLKANADMSEISKKYQDALNTRIEVSKSILKTATEAYNKQLDLSMENNKNVLEEINGQVNVMVNQSQKFWSDLTTSIQVPITKEEKIAKDSISPEIKKRTSIPANELSDHKA
jgi:hypothetical protein